MNEYLNCDDCTAVVSTSMKYCDYCGNDFRHSGTSSKILRFRDEIDNKFLVLSSEKFIKLINSSPYKEHPIIKYRKVKSLLIEYMTNDGELDSREFCELINSIISINNYSSDYLNDFVLYVSVIFPTSKTKMKLETYFSIKDFLESINLDVKSTILEKAKEQVLMTDLGENFLKDYNFYTNPKNFINDSNFLEKRNYLTQKYEHEINKFN